MSTVSGNGWTCANCLMFVPTGYEHKCLGRLAGMLEPTVSFAPTVEQRIAAALERIASALEASTPS